uniref:DUF7823 domain-containing protein n=1 Tax=Xenorhabdus sp. TH1 TaxID=3130166 RepID=UPI00404005FD
MSSKLQIYTPADYLLGNSSENNEEYLCTSQYQSADAKKLGVFLQQNVSKTFHFCFNWL